MPVISPEQFIQLADRLAATYELLIQAEKRYMASQNLASYQQGQTYPARLLLDLTNTGSHALLMASNNGVSGNNIYFSIVVPSTPNSDLSSQSMGTNLVLSLGTDAGGNPVTTVLEALSFMTSNTDFTDYIEIAFPVSGTEGQVQPYPMTALSGGAGTDGGDWSMPLFSIVVTQPGPQGNDYTLTINQQTGNSLPFNFCCTGTDLVINLPTDSTGATTETLGQLQTDLEAATDDFMVITDSPDSPVPVISPPVSFSGGGVGSYAQVVLTPPPGSPTGTADPNVVSSLLTQAQALDANFTAQNLEQGIAFLSNLQGAMVNHFISVGYSGGMPGFMTDFSIMVHKNFSTLNNNRAGGTLLAANVFRPDQIVLGTVGVGLTGTFAFTPGTPLGNGDPTLPQTETNYGPQALVAVLAPATGILQADWSFTLNLIDNNNSPQVSDPITFTANDVAGKAVPITAGLSVKFYSVNNATLGSKTGSNGDQVFITQVIERQISL